MLSFWLPMLTWFGALTNASSNSECTVTSEWPGWDAIKYAFIFGDSYTQTGFNYTLTPPSLSNPLGNPDYPGWTASNGPNWVGYLTYEYNASVIQTYNFAYGGATVDSDLIAPYTDTVLSLKDQVNDEFIPGYTGDAPTAPSAPAWTGSDSLFAIWIGINDIGNSYYLQNDTLISEVFAVYETLAATIIGAGARNIVFINVPAIDRSPLSVAQGEESVALEKEAIAYWNQEVVAIGARLKEASADSVNVWVYDSETSFNQVMDDPTVYPETAGLKNTTDYCVEYENGTPEEDTFIESCGVPVNEYFWLNNLHPTPAINAVVARQIVEGLNADPNVC
ncbi:carbohydrate esterase family 16 protein [Xylariomycetidae sp. FL2044]|nr:carbohydrate esterase family 16 protein [Xylariomycetidae sp. FL2044]